MNRWLLIPVLLVVVLASLVFAAQNAGEVSLVLYGATIALPLGVLVLASLFTGCLAAGIVLWSGVILPLRLRLRHDGRRAADGRGDAAA